MTTRVTISCGACQRILGDVAPPAPPVPVLCPPCARAQHTAGGADYPDGFVIGPAPIPAMPACSVCGRDDVPVTGTPAAAARCERCAE